MASCSSCGTRLPSATSGSLCALCVAKMINYAQGEYHDYDDPAVKHFERTAAGLNSPKPSNQGGCATVIVAGAGLLTVIATAMAFGLDVIA